MNNMTHPTSGDTSNLAGDVIELMRGMLKWQEYFEKALSYVDNSYTFNDLVMSVLANQRQFYDFGDAAVLMQYEKYPQYSVYHCFIACGNKQTIFEQHDMMNEIAQKMGCKYLTLSGRKGWERDLVKHGWEHKLSTMYREVT